jgi:hypothetical protein
MEILRKHSEKKLKKKKGRNVQHWKRKIYMDQENLTVVFFLKFPWEITKSIHEKNKNQNQCKSIELIWFATKTQKKKHLRNIS